MTLPPLPAPKAPGDRFQQQQIAEQKMRLKWRLQRISPPKCLVCGSIAIVPLEHGKTVETTRGPIHCQFEALAATKSDGHCFPAEGDLLKLGRA